MKKVLLILVFVLLAASLLADPKIPQANGFINDHVGLLGDRQIRRLEEKARTYHEQSGHEIAVLIVQSLDNRALEDFAHDVFQAWGIGSADRDNGVLFLVSLDERQARIEVGYGLEAALTDIECGRLVNKHSPMAQAFRNKDYAGGIGAVLDGMKQAIGGEYNPTRPKETSGGYYSWIGFALLALMAILFVAVMRRNIAEFRQFGSSYRQNWKGGTGNHRRNGSSGTGGFTWGGGSGFGGGGFSGGSSGGGGASGGW